VSGAETDTNTVREALRFSCDAISQAIGEGCGECGGCLAWAALSRLSGRVTAAEQSARTNNELADKWQAECGRLGEVEDALSGRVTELEQRADYYALALRAIDGLPDSQGESMRAIARATLAAAALAGSAGQEQA
jgi:hypothetical protein